jgi:hypothetical protein
VDGPGEIFSKISASFYGLNLIAFVIYPPFIFLLIHDSSTDFV